MAEIIDNKPSLEEPSRPSSMSPVPINEIQQAASILLDCFSTPQEEFLLPPGSPNHTEPETLDAHSPPPTQPLQRKATGKPVKSLKKSILRVSRAKAAAKPSSSPSSSSARPSAPTILPAAVMAPPPEGNRASRRAKAQRKAIDTDPEYEEKQPAKRSRKAKAGMKTNRWTEQQRTWVRDYGWPRECRKKDRWEEMALDYARKFARGRTPGNLRKMYIKLGTGYELD